MTLELSDAQAEALSGALQSYGENLRAELARTDRVELRKAIRAESELLQQVRRRLADLLAVAGAPASG